MGQNGTRGKTDLCLYLISGKALGKINYVVLNIAFKKDFTQNLILRNKVTHHQKIRTPSIYAEFENVGILPLNFSFLPNCVFWKSDGNSQKQSAIEGLNVITYIPAAKWRKFCFGAKRNTLGWGKMDPCQTAEFGGFKMKNSGFEMKYH